MKRTRVILVDGQAPRAELRAMFERLPDVEVVGEADDGRTALDLIGLLQPDHVLFARSVVEALLGSVPPAPLMRRPEIEPDKLTFRQRQILQLIAEGHSTKQIAQGLRISVKTVESHRAQLMQRLNIRHVAGLVHYAIRCGIVAPA